MKRVFLLVLSVCCGLVLAGALLAADKPAANKAWAFNATVIEACSCPMFCQCYFSTSPASHSMADMPGMEGKGHDEAYCKFNNAYKVNKGTYNGVSLAGAKFWVACDLGTDAPIVWEHNMGSDEAHATLDGGKAAEVTLKSSVAHNAAGPTVIKNLKYFGVPRNDGFVLMPNTVEAYRIGDKP